MGYLESLLEVRGLDECPLPLWKLKITEEEFDCLRGLLEKRTHIINVENPFISVCKEAALFFAEYWRRLYVDGVHSKQMVYDALESTRSSVNFSEEFFAAAWRGAQLLHIEEYAGGIAQHLNDMLYQGGLPMKLVTSNINNSLWDRFTRGLINRKIDFDDLNLGVVASQSNSMREYCEQLIKGIETERCDFMPFYCDNENNSWFLYLKRTARQERVRRSQLNPYSLKWELRIDTIERKIYASYVVKGLQHLPQAFLEEQGLDGLSFFSIQVRKNGQVVDTFDYVNNFCRYPIVSKHTYTVGDYISLFFNNQEEPYLGNELDITVPHLLFMNSDGAYELGNRIGSQESLLLIPEGWTVSDKHHLEVNEYSWGELKLSGIIIPDNFNDNIIVQGEDGTLTFGINVPLYWTEMKSHPMYVPDVIESVYDAGKCSFMLCYDNDGGTESRRSEIQYRNKWQNEWSSVPSYGEIFARAVDRDNNYVTPVRFVNIGDGLSINLLEADKDYCKISVTWPHGSVSALEGRNIGESVWQIERNNCVNPGKIRFIFTPRGNANNQFILSVKAPFKDFSIVDIYGSGIKNDCWIPFSDIDKYQYHLVGQNIEYTYGKTRRKLCWQDDKLYIYENGHRLKNIPYEGSLLTLFDSRENLSSLLERTSRNILNAEIKVQFTFGNCQTISFSVKESPFRPRQIDNGRVVITGNNNEPVEYTSALKLIKLDEPNLEPVKMCYNEEAGCYILPEEIRTWGKTILVGRTRGRICPALVDLTREMDRAYRQSNRENAIAAIKENLKDSTLGDELWERIIGWFDRTQNDDIPASSILELYCTAQDYKSLLFMAFQLYVRCNNNEDKNVLREQLKVLSNDLAFQWYWLRPYLDGVLMQLYPFIKDPMSPVIQEIYVKWAMEHEGDKMMEYLKALNNADAYMEYMGQCLHDVLTSFTDWLKELCVSSMLDTYDNNSQTIETTLADCIINKPGEICRIEIKEDNFIDTNQDCLGENVDVFFSQYSESGKSDNELWFIKRVNAVVAHLHKSIDLFSVDDEIRRSIIYCCKSSNKQFLVLLNNKLVY